VGTDPDGTCGEDTGGWVFFLGTDTNGESTLLNHTFDCEDPPEQATFAHFDTLKANTPARVFIYIGSGVMGVIGDESPDLGQRLASFDFDFDLGVCPSDPCVPPDPDNPPGPGDPNWDFDQDGLIDGWEMDGIDFDGDGEPEIDLPGLGAVAGTRDIFVEIDIMEGVAFDQSAIDDVVRAFATAPPTVPGGNPGINLNVLVDTDQPARGPLNLLTNNNLPPEYYTIKDAFFGTAVDRSHPDWDQIRPIRLGIFRYCLWADTVIDEDGDGISGVAEAIPSNDFVVAGSVQSWFTNPVDATNGLAGTFMHELGHAIDLLHGGQENSPNYKPNYLSVMNYAYQLPNTAPTAQFTNARDAWRLDYSRSATRSLDESELVETDGLDGQSGRMMLFNSAPETQDPTINIGWANAAEIDWNNNSTFEANPYQLDISRLRSGVDLSYDILNSYSDWDRLWLNPSGGMVFDDRQPWPFAKRVFEGITQESYLAIQNAEWVDQTALGDLVFENGFDLGSTTAWSETVP